jgi:hypothetical protein
MGDRDAFARAHSVGSLLQAIREAISPDPVERKSLASDLAALHNDGTIDLVATFSGLSGAAESGPEFFLLRHVFEEVLPHLEAPVAQVAQCVQRLYREAGTDMAAGTVLDAFRDFCAKRPERVPAALSAIEAAPEVLSDLVVAALVAGSTMDPAAYVAEAIRLAGHANLELRRRALFAIGRLDLAKATGGREQALAVIEKAVDAEDDDQVLACAIKSAFALSRTEGKTAPQLTAAIATALARGGEISLHAASEVFGFQTSDIPPDLLELLLERLAQVKISNKGTLNNIDYGVAHLLKSGDATRGLRFLEALLAARSNELDFEAFDDTARTIRDTPGLRSKVATRWLFSGKPELCEGVATILDSPRSEALEIEADAGEIENVEPARLLFGARKAIGYLFLRPISAASFVVSLLGRAPADPPLQGALEALLLNPLLINFSGNVAEYLGSRAAIEEEPVKAAIQRSLDGLERYLAGLRSVGEIAALHPSLEHRDAYRRHFAGEMARSFKKAQAESVLMQLVHRSVLLYGRKAIHHVIGPEGEINRMETHLGSHGTQIEVPRLTILDPHGLDYMLRVFRHERLES